MDYYLNYATTTVNDKSCQLRSDPPIPACATKSCCWDWMESEAESMEGEGAWGWAAGECQDQMAMDGSGAGKRPAIPSVDMPHKVLGVNGSTEIVWHQHWE